MSIEKCKIKTTKNITIINEKDKAKTKKQNQPNEANQKKPSGLPPLQPLHPRGIPEGVGGGRGLVLNEQTNQLTDERTQDQTYKATNKPTQDQRRPLLQETMFAASSHKSSQLDTSTQLCVKTKFI